MFAYTIAGGHENDVVFFVLSVESCGGMCGTENFNRCMYVCMCAIVPMATVTGGSMFICAFMCSVMGSFDPSIASHK